MTRQATSPDSNKVSDILRDMIDRFRAAELASPALDARLIMQHVTGLSREDLVLNYEHKVTPEHIEKIKELSNRRLAREPVSRLLGRREFWGLDFKLSPDTLDPRPDSEVVVQAALEHAGENDPARAWRILDLGTGSGCLLLALLNEIINATGTGVDVSAGAVETARDNAAALGLDARATFVEGDWKTMDMPDGFDIIVANPPYIPDAEIETLEPEVRRYEPRHALAAGADGLDCHREIAKILPEILVEDGAAMIEIGSDQGEQTARIYGATGLSVKEVRKDLAGNDRCVIAHRTR